MSFRKRFVGKTQLKEIEVDINKISYYLSSDCLIFETQEISNQFKSYEKEYVTNRSLTV